MPSSRSAASARSTRLSLPTVTGVPYGMRDERQGDDGCSDVGSPSARERSRISALENPNIASGETTPYSRAARAPGRWSLRSSAFVPSATTSMPTRARRGHDVGPELRLAEVAAVGRIGRVARILQLVRVDLEELEPDRARGLARGDPLALGIRRASPDDGEHAVRAEHIDGDRREIRRVDAAAVSDRDSPLLAQPAAQLSFLVGRHAGNVIALDSRHARTTSAGRHDPGRARLGRDRLYCRSVVTGGSRAGCSTGCSDR